MKVSVRLDTNNLICSHCGKANLKRSLRVITNNVDVNIGVTCAGKIFQQNLSGNPYKAAERLQLHINTSLKENVEDLLNF